MDVFTGLTDNIALGLEVALSPANILYCLLGVVFGMIVGVLPGIGSLAAISLLFPFTFSLDPTSALIMLAGIFYGTAYGGSIAAILLNVPGSPSSAVVCLDGYPLAQQGRAGAALFLTTVSSFFAGSVGIILMMIAAPVLVAVARQIGSAEYFALLVLGIVAASSISESSAAKGLAMVVAGALLGTIGTDVYTGTNRFTMGIPELMDGVSLVAFAMGLFGLTEIMTGVLKSDVARVTRVRLRQMIPSRDEMRLAWLPTLRGTAIGSFFGTLPGTGATMASFMAYTVEKKVARDPSRFGKGAIEGICAPEAANNAADQTAFIPTMSLGIPGSVTMALLLGVLIINGIQPGPQLVTQQPEMFWGLVLSFWLGNLMLVILNIPLIGLWVKMLQIPYQYLYPTIIVFICLGVFTVYMNTFDIWVVAIFGIVGFGMRQLGLPATSFLIGFILGPLTEEHFRRAMLISSGDFSTFLTRPISAGVLSVAALILGWSIWKGIAGWLAQRNETASDARS